MVLGNILFFLIYFNNKDVQTQIQHIYKLQQARSEEPVVVNAGCWKADAKCKLQVLNFEY